MYGSGVNCCLGGKVRTLYLKSRSETGHILVLEYWLFVRAAELLREWLRIEPGADVHGLRVAGVDVLGVLGAGMGVPRVVRYGPVYRYRAWTSQYPGMDQSVSRHGPKTV